MFSLYKALQLKLTRQYGWHEGREHEEQHTEEEKSGVVISLGSVVADVEVKEADHDADR